MPFYIYIIECSDGTLYTGQTNNLEERIKNHQAGKGARYTRTRLPIKLLWNIPVETRSHALKGERYIKKHLGSSNKRRLANGNVELRRQVKKAMKGLSAPR